MLLVNQIASAGERGVWRAVAVSFVLFIAVSAHCQGWENVFRVGTPAVQAGTSYFAPHPVATTAQGIAVTPQGEVVVTGVTRNWKQNRWMRTFSLQGDSLNHQLVSYPVTTWNDHHQVNQFHATPDGGSLVRLSHDWSDTLQKFSASLQQR